MALRYPPEPSLPRLSDGPIAGVTPSAVDSEVKRTVTRQTLAYLWNHRQTDLEPAGIRRQHFFTDMSLALQTMLRWAQGETDWDTVVEWAERTLHLPVEDRPGGGGTDRPYPAQTYGASPTASTNPTPAASAPTT